MCSTEWGAVQACADPWTHLPLLLPHGAGKPSSCSAFSPLGLGCGVGGSAWIVLGVRCLPRGTREWQPEADQPVLQDKDQLTISVPQGPPFSCPQQFTGADAIQSSVFPALASLEMQLATIK